MIEPATNQIPDADGLERKQRWLAGGKLGIDPCTDGLSFVGVLTNTAPDRLAVLSEVEPPRTVVLVDGYVADPDSPGPAAAMV